MVERKNKNINLSPEYHQEIQEYADLVTGMEERVKKVRLPEAIIIAVRADKKRRERLLEAAARLAAKPRKEA